MDLIGGATIKNWLDEACRAMSRPEVMALVAAVLNISRSDIILKSEQTLDDETIAHLNTAFAQRLAGKPLSRIIGQRGFWKGDFRINHATLDPRPESELIIESAIEIFKQRQIDHNQPKTIADLGTGSGCILISLLGEFQEAMGVGLDINSDAIAQAQENAEIHGVDGRCHYQVNDWLKDIEQSFDLIIANPPYIVSDVIQTLSPEVKDHDPLRALDGGEDGLDAYRTIANQLRRQRNLANDGILLLEIGYDQKQAIKEIFIGAGFKLNAAKKDYSGHDRVMIFSNHKRSL